MEATFTSKGQITIPAEVREQLHLKKGDRVSIEVENGVIKMSPKKGTLEEFMNVLPKSERSFTVEEMNKAIAQAACESGN